MNSNAADSKSSNVYFGFSFSNFVLLRKKTGIQSQKQEQESVLRIGSPRSSTEYQQSGQIFECILIAETIKQMLKRNASNNTNSNLNENENANVNNSTNSTNSSSSSNHGNQSQILCTLVNTLNEFASILNADAQLGGTQNAVGNRSIYCAAGYFNRPHLNENYPNGKCWLMNQNQKSKLELDPFANANRQVLQLPRNYLTYYYSHAMAGFSSCLNNQVNLLDNFTFFF
jgi:hypothetical protein